MSLLWYLKDPRGRNLSVRADSASAREEELEQRLEGGFPKKNYWLSIADCFAFKAPKINEEHDLMDQNLTISALPGLDTELKRLQAAEEELQWCATQFEELRSPHCL